MNGTEVHAGDAASGHHDDACGQIDGVVLAGGNASRMQAALGSDGKAWLTLGNLALIEHVTRNLAPQVNALYISTHDEPARFARIGTPVCDAADERLGPLAGVLAAMVASRAGWLAVAPCDCPFLPPAWVARLHGAAHQAQAPLALASHQGFRQPVCMIVRGDLKQHLGDALARGVRKVGQWQREVGAIVVPFDDAPDHAFMNINTPDDLAQAEQQLQGRQPRAAS